MSKIIIKRQNFEVSVDRTELVSVAETPDGVVFDFKGGLQLLQYDQNMTSATKNLIKNSVDNFTVGNLLIELDNFKTPVKIDAT
jgi:hypothetical protein